jgi:hypothetical protein
MVQLTATMPTATATMPTAIVTMPTATLLTGLFYRIFDPDRFCRTLSGRQQGWGANTVKSSKFNYSSGLH